MKIAKKVVDRVSAGLKQFKPIADQHKARDVSEADTVNPPQYNIDLWRD